MAMMNTFKEGMALSAGSMVVQMVFVGVGLLLFIPGLVIVMTQMKKPKKEQNGSLKIVGYVLMGLGVVVGMGTGAYFLMGMVTEDILDG